MAGTDQLERDILAEVVSLGVPYELIACDPDFADTARFCEKYGVPPGQSGNTILVATRRDPKKYALCVVLATHRLDVNRAVKKILGGKCSFATAEETVRVTGMQIGGVTPFQLPEDLPVLVDPGLFDLEWVVLGGGGRTSKIKISPEVFRRLPGVQVVEGLTVPRS